MLSVRAEKILNFIVGQHVEKAVPVPSQSIANDSELGVSPATIRNEMARLEQEGYIIRAHPSAGSIPSDKGYRYYVESLKELMLSPSEQRLMSHLFHQVEKELEKWLSLAATLLAQQVQNVAVVTTPKSADCRFKHLELVHLQDSLALVVIVLHGAKVRQQLIIFDQVVAQPELTAMANRLNAAFAGLTRRKILEKDPGLSPVEQQIADLLLNMMKTEDEQQYEEPYLDGWHFMLEQPEFTRGHQMLDLIELVEHRSLLQNIIPKELRSHQVQVIIGKENKSEAFHNCSVVISKYGVPDEAVGTVGVLGPTRMSYAHTISAVGYLSSLLSGLVAGLYGRGNA
ncbi:MAG TPA: heat-inducible transcriptional repressor HrcA [Dehalococcoidales bacterium]|nr:heat-inducible transcriptional repressor HrcA [Dehalococcoidales bacterium]